MIDPRTEAAVWARVRAAAGCPSTPQERPAKKNKPGSGGLPAVLLLAALAGKKVCCRSRFR